MPRILVTGDRQWRAREVTRAALLALLGTWAAHEITIVHGANGYDEDGRSSYKSKKPTVRGADMIAHEEALKLGMEVEPYPAAWKTYRQGAGPIRNSVMRNSGIDGVIAFHDDLFRSKGTKDMVKKCEGIAGCLYKSSGAVYCLECYKYTGHCPACHRAL